MLYQILYLRHATVFTVLVFEVGSCFVPGLFWILCILVAGMMAQPFD
jgi:hypothetical protein